jgi:signal transduction histidine kinase
VTAGLSLRFRLTGGLLIVLFLALFILVVVVFVWQRLGLQPVYLWLGLAGVAVVNLFLLGLFADYRLRILVLEPVERMVRGSERVARGDETHRLEASDTVELARLASAVNGMADRLIQHQQQLSENVASLDRTNRELSDARGRLVRAEKLASMGRLAAGVAHEVGNPLGAIMGYVELARRREDVDGEWVDGISHEARRIDEIVRGLLEYARPKAAAPRQLDVNEIVSRTVELLKVQRRFQRVEPVVALADDLPPVQADPFQLEQVMVNLLLNAGDAIAETGGRGTVEVTTRTLTVSRQELGMGAARRSDDPQGVDYSHLRRRDQSEDPGPARQLKEGERAVEIAVRDTGPGIEPTDVQRVFDPFFTTKPPGKGTGLGLAVSARLVEGMGGSMEAVPSEEPGATFRVLLPVAREEVE